jgi:hypothetical protein
MEGTSEGLATSREATPPPSRRDAGVPARSGLARERGETKARERQAGRRSCSGPMGKAPGRLKTRRATACRQTLNGPDQARLSGEEGPEDGLPGRSRGVMNLDEIRVRRHTLLACWRRAEQRQEGSVVRKDAPPRREEKGPEG